MNLVKPAPCPGTCSGVISDIGGPTANMYQMRCTRPEVEAKCKRLSCVHPTVCKLLGTDHGPLVELMRKARAMPLGSDRRAARQLARALRDLAKTEAWLEGQAPRPRPMPYNRERPRSAAGFRA